MQLPYSAVLLLKHVLTYTGEKIVDGNGNEALDSRRLNPEESSQRRHFMAAIEEKIKENQEKLNEKVEAHKAKLEEKKLKYQEKNPQSKDELYENFEKRMFAALDKDAELIALVKEIRELDKQIGDEPIELSLTEKTVAVVKKYFNQYGEKIGYPEADDKNVELINKAL